MRVNSEMREQCGILGMNGHREGCAFIYNLADVIAAQIFTGISINRRVLFVISKFSKQLYSIKQ